MSWRGHTTTSSEDQLVRQLDAIGMTDAVDLIERLDNALFTAEERVRDLEEQEDQQ